MISPGLRQGVAGTLAEASQAAAQICGVGGQQATGMAQIHQAMKNIDQVARQNLAAMRQAEQAAQNLNALGTELSDSTPSEESNHVGRQEDHRGLCPDGWAS